MCFLNRVKKTVLIMFISVVVMIIIFALFYLLYFHPSYHSEEFRGTEYYSDGSYLDFGYRGNKYGEIASAYLPGYLEVSREAVYVDFYYKDSTFMAKKYVVVCIGARYEETTYQEKLDDILLLGEDFGECNTYDELTIKHRLISKKDRFNGEDMYYIISYCDEDKSIMYTAFFSNGDYYDSFYSISEEIYFYRTDISDFFEKLFPKYFEVRSIYQKTSTK